MSSFTTGPFVCDPCYLGRFRRTPPSGRGQDGPGDLHADPPTPGIPAPLIAPAELAALLDGPRPPVVLDVRWRLGGPPGRADHEAGHVPGAVFVDLDAELAGPPGARRAPPAARSRRSAGGAAPRRRAGGVDRRRLRRRLGRGRRAGLVAAALGGGAGGPGRGARRRVPGLGRRGSAGHRRALAPGARGRRGPPRRHAGRRRRRRRGDGAARACCSTPAPVRATAARPSRSTRRRGTSPAR